MQMGRPERGWAPQALPEEAGRAAGLSRCGVLKVRVGSPLGQLRNELSPLSREGHCYLDKQLAVGRLACR